MEMDFSDTEILDRIFEGMKNCSIFPNIYAPKAKSALDIFQNTKISYIPKLYLPSLRDRGEGGNGISLALGPDNNIENYELSNVIIQKNKLLSLKSLVNSYHNIKSIITWFNQNNFNSIAHIFSGCEKLSKICYIDTRNVQSFNTTFHACSSLTEIEWEINMQCATDVRDMFLESNIKDNGVTLINVPRTLDLSKIGIASSKYTIKNYIETALEPSIE